MKRTKKYIKNKYVIGGLVLIFIIIVIILRSGGSNNDFEYAEVKIGNVSERVGITGQVMPIDKADLSFGKSGIVQTIAVKVGDKVKRGQLIASLDSSTDKASLLSTEAELAEISRGLRPEEYASDESLVKSALTTLENSKKSSLDSFRDGYVKAQGAVMNYTDTFFNNPQSANPTINIRTQSYTIENIIHTKRISVTENLNRWKSDIDSLVSNPDALALLVKADRYISTLKSYMSDLSGIVNDLNPGNSGLTQATIDSYVTSMNNALSGLNQAILSITSAETILKNAFATYDQANYEFTLKKAGSSDEKVRAGQAKVAQMRAELSKNIIISPIRGTVTKVSPELGEFVTLGQNTFSVQSVGEYKIEAYVPEADIAKVAIDNSADVTLDAYGANTIFPAIVTAIDPAETVMEGVPTYKVTLIFKDIDERIRSGMTANTEILTHNVNNVLTIPSRAVIDENGIKTIRIVNKNGKSFEKVEVVIGLKGSDGMIEIISGVNEGQEVVTYLK